MKKTLAALLLISTSSIWACPKLSGGHPQDLSVINDYTNRLQQISSNTVYNKTAYSCFKENVEEISWDQTVALASRLRDASYTNQEKSIVTEKMARDYLDANFDVTFADVAVEISRRMGTRDEANKLIYKYFKKALNRKMVNFEQLMILFNGLQRTSYASSAEKVEEKMARIFIKEKTAEINLPQIKELASHRYTYRKANQTLERYFEAHLSHLSWEETVTLMSFLYDNQYDGRYSKIEVKERMTLKWNKAHN